jgi:hypothetical protein
LLPTVLPLPAVLLGDSLVVGHELGHRVVEIPRKARNVATEFLELRPERLYRTDSRHANQAM